MAGHTYVYTYLGLFDKIAEWIFSGIAKAISWLFQAIFAPVFKAVLEPLAQAIIDAIVSALSSVFYLIFEKLLLIIYIIERAFQVFGGVSQVTYEPGGGDKYLIDILFENNAVGLAFRGILILAFLLCFVFTFVAVSRSIFELDLDNKRPVGVILNSCFKSFIAFLIVPVMCFAGVRLSSAVLAGAYEASNPGASASIASSLFEVCASEAAMKKGGQPGLDSLRRELSSGGTPLWQDVERVKRYMDIADIDYVIGYASAIFMIWNLTGVCFVFIERLFGVILLFLASPFFVAAMPLDGGDRFKKWQSAFVGKLATGLGAILLVNIYLIVVPLIMGDQINLTGGAVSGTVQQLYNYLLKLLFILGAMLAIKHGNSLLTGLIDSQAGSSESAAAGAVTGFMTNTVRKGSDKAKERLSTRGVRAKERAEKKAGKAFVKSEKEYRKNLRTADVLEAHGDKAGADNLRSVAERRHKTAIDSAVKSGIAERKRDKDGNIVEGKIKFRKDLRVSSCKASFKAYQRLQGKTTVNHRAMKAVKKLSAWDESVKIGANDLGTRLRSRGQSLGYRMTDARKSMTDAGKSAADGFRRLRDHPDEVAADIGRSIRSIPRRIGDTATDLKNQVSNGISDARREGVEKARRENHMDD